MFGKKARNTALTVFPHPSHYTSFTSIFGITVSITKQNFSDEGPEKFKKSIDVSSS